ncbi:hypothetical protein QQF64_024133 [Cirrhinus molitorella]|uniref:LINE-1 type transposase domain-containing protein 1 n=1 Tax=Cirrhinus molitorella TaxID=172907 RepID=A0ABR3NKL4_9TELE
MAKRQLLPSSPEKKRQKEPVNETLRAMVADELKLQFGVVREIFKEEFLPIAERIGSLEKEMRLISNNFDNVQTAVRKVKQDSAEVKLIVDTLQDKMAKLEDKSRQCNIRLVGLAEGEEGSDALGYMQTQLPLWIPSLKNRSFEIDRAHRIYTGDSNRKSPRTLIFKLLRFQDRNAILNGARAAGQILHKGNSLLFFPDYSNQTAMKRREMNQSRKRLTQLGISSFLIYPATIKVTHRGSTSLLQTPTDVKVYIDQQQELATPQPLGDSTLAGMLTDASA